MSSLQIYLDQINADIKAVEGEIKELEKKRTAALEAIQELEQQRDRSPFKQMWDDHIKVQRQILTQYETQLTQHRFRLGQLQAKREQVQGQIERERRQREAEREQLRQQNLTRGDLVPAMIYPVDSGGNQLETYFATAEHELKPLTFMFNPQDYTIKKKNKYENKGLNKNRTYNLEYNSEVKPRTLTLSALWFDTLETGEDVRQYTDILMNYVEVGAGAGVDFSTANSLIQQPPYIAFEWGTFRFMAVITSVSIDFVIFRPDGTPVRAKATVSFTEFKHRKIYARQNPSSGDGPDTQSWSVSAGDRLDTIAAQVYGDASKWRLIADYNHLVDPLALRPGQTLTIPSLWEV
jgi:hypothetical protein